MISEYGRSWPILLTACLAHVGCGGAGSSDAGVDANDAGVDAAPPSGCEAVDCGAGRCELLDDIPMCRCDAGFQSRGPMCVRVVADGVVLPLDEFPVDSSAIIVDKDAPNAGDDIVPGRGTEELPFASIQHAVARLGVDGSVVYVKPSVEPYFEPYRLGGQSTAGITIAATGSADSPFLVSGYPGLPMPVIDQQKSRASRVVRFAPDGTLSDEFAETTPSSVDCERLGSCVGPELSAGALPFQPPMDCASRYAACMRGYTHGLNGFYLVGGAAYVTIRGFEIRNTLGSGIMFDPSDRTEAITVERNYLHHAYGVDNVGGVRLDDTSRTVVRENIISHIYGLRWVNREGTNEAPTNALDDEPYLLASGVHGYRPDRCEIYNNEIFHVKKAIFEKQSAFDSLPGHRVRRNLIHDATEFAFELGQQGSGTPSAQDDLFVGNLVIDVPAVVSHNTAEGDNEQPKGFLFEANTIVGSRAAFGGNDVIGVVFRDNVIRSTSEESVMLSMDTRSAHDGFFDEVNHNAYEFLGPTVFILGRYDTDPQYFRSFEDWQTAYSSGRSNGVLGADPDLDSIATSLEFVDPAAGDYRLRSGSAAATVGVGGKPAGAYPTLREHLGPSWTLDSL